MLSNNDLKILKNPEKIRKPEKFLVKKIFISYLRSKQIIQSKNMIENAEILRFEKNPGKSEKKKKVNL